MGVKIKQIGLVSSLLLLLLCSTATRSTATHVAAGDIYMDYIGSGPTQLKYLITLVVYKACEPNNAALSPTENVTFKSSCYSNITRTLQPTIPGSAGDTMDQLCANFAPQNACRVPGSVWPAFVRKVYTDTITLPVACADWRVEWSLCCRNNQIINLTAPGGYNLYLETGINNVARWNNSTPRFYIPPIPYLCVNQPSFFLNGPLDPDNDSIVTENVQPMTTFGAVCNYAGGASLANPIQSSSTPAYYVNPNTGTASFTPGAQGKFVLAFECTDYDRLSGVKLSYTRRDVQVVVLNCNASPPDIDSIPMNVNGATFQQNPDQIVACPGTEFSFTVNTQSNTISNAVFLSANNALVAPGSNFMVTGNGTSNPTGVFTWTPTVNDIGDYTIIITTKDSTCNNNQPIVLRNYLTVYIRVFHTVDAGPPGRICEYEGVPWQFNVQGPDGITYVWSDLTGGNATDYLSNDSIPNPTAYPPHNVTYVVEALNVLGVSCKTKDTVQVYIDTTNYVVAEPQDLVLCRPGYLQLSAEGYGRKPLANLACGSNNDLPVPYPSCAVEDTIQVNTQFSGGNVNYSSTYTPYPGNYRSAHVQMLLAQSDMYAYGVRSGTINSISFEVLAPTTTTFNNFKISVKCTERNSLSAATGGMEGGLTEVYSASGSVTTVMGWNTYVFDKPYNWDSTKSLIIDICYSNPSNGSPAAVNSVLTADQQMVISYATGGSANVCETPTSVSGMAYHSSRPVVRLNFCTAPEQDFQYTWFPGNYLSDSTTQKPLAFISETSTYHVQTTGGNGCKVRDSLTIRVPIHNYDVWPKDTAMCGGESFRMEAQGDFAHVQWYEYDSNTGDFVLPVTLSCQGGCADAGVIRDPIARPTQTMDYYAVMTDADGCADTMKVRAVIKPMPDVKIVNNDTTIRYGQSIQLLVSGAYMYSWTPLSTLSNPNIVNPVASPREPTMYYVLGVADNGCRNTDSVYVDIDYRDNLFVPTAFTPNGDGKNDIFRVSNITFQRLLEFRVFNRWGQEIFSTNDIRKGWDGSWRGVPQDMGSYQYLIRVAYPDGYVEMYKGDVTLVR